MKKAAIIAAPLAVMLFFPLLMVLAMAGVGGITQAVACTTGSTLSGGGAFGIGTLNWRGASHHTTNPHPGEQPYATRVPHMIAKINASGASIIGFQEFEPPQAHAFTKAVGGQWDLVAGKAHGKRATANAIAYQPSKWKVDRVRYVSIRYGGPMIQIPLARFTSTTGLGSVWVLNTHHPANVVNGSNAMRDSAVRAEAKALRELQTAEPGTPLFLTGDMNDRARFKRLFLYRAGPGWSSATPTDRQIDWIMGGPGVTFTGTVVDQSTNDRAHNYTDHPFVHTTARLPGTNSISDVDITGGFSNPISGQLSLAQANIPTKSGMGRSGMGGFRSSMPKVLSHQPDFVTLNEQTARSLRQIEAAAPGYSAYRDNSPATGAGANQALGTVVLYKRGWQLLDGGRVQIVDDDHTVDRGRPVVWDRFATWALLKRPRDGAIVSVVSVHQMSNPAKYGPDKPARQAQYGQAQYGQGMDTLTGLTRALARHGPVFVGGDFNVHPSKGTGVHGQGDDPWAAPMKMAAAGFAAYSHGVDYLFYPKGRGVTLARGWTGPMVSDHQWISARFNMNGAGPSSGTAAASTTTASTSTTASVAPAVATTSTTLRPDENGNVHIGQWTLNAEQFHNAQTMVSMASARGGSQAALVIIIAALAESGLSTNRGSMGGAHGVLQQTPSAGWGTRAQVMDVSYATTAFLDHLAGVPNWRSKDPWVAAQAVQRSGAGDPSSAYYKEHHLTWGYGGNYRVKLDQARAIIAALGGTIVPASDCSTNAAMPSGVKGNGSFTPNTQIPYLGPYDQATLMSRMQRVMAANGSANVDPFFGTEPDGSWYHDCQHFVANLQGRSSSGYASAQAAWSHFLGTGAAHPATSADGMRPPVGAWLYYASGEHGHVVVYLGNNLVAGTDTWGTGTAKIGPASDITDGAWNLPYLGWAAPWGASANSSRAA
jgi:endonuclease/exonuclease/phosphatase (EEP) superfamily protein YafD